jgi:RNA polymerase sigma-70 factor (sigma-E family)
MTSGRRGAASSREDELLARLYQRITERQVTRFAAGYDMAAGLDRYRAWLGEHAAGEHSRQEAVELRGFVALRAGLADAHAAAAAGGMARPAVASGIAPGSTGTGGATAAGASWGAEQAMTEHAMTEQAITALYSTHYRSLVRLAALLVSDVATAEEIVQDSFVAMHTAWRRIRDDEEPLSYLRQSVVNRSRSVLRHRVVLGRDAAKPAPDMPTAEQGALTLLERSAVIAVLRSLPPRQREALVLRYYGDLSEAQIASAMGISRSAVKVHMARAIASLRAVLEMEK